MSSLNSKIKLLIFDLDGTLVDSLIDITNAINYALKPWNYNLLTPETARKLVGRGITKLVESILKPEHKRELNKVLDRFLDYYKQHLTDHTRLYPHVKEVLSVLGSYKKAVLSNKRENLSRQILHELTIAEYFDYVIGSDTLSEKKPSPVGIFYLLERESLTPEQAMIIGDSEIDIQTGKAAGVITVAVGYGYRDPELLRGADFFIKDSIIELLNILDSC